MDAATATALWNANANKVESINFGNGNFCLYYESEGRSYIAIPEDPHAEQKPQIRSVLAAHGSTRRNG